MRKRDPRPIPETAEEIRLVASVRNEVTRLPYLLAYYRQLGVERFLFADDTSDDGTTEYLLAQPDCHVFQPATSYSAANSGTHWQNELLDGYCIGRWSAIIDADELLIYPHCEQVKLKEFCRYLDQEGSVALYAFMLDMYPDHNLSQAVCEAGKPFYEICRYFDRDYRFIKRFDLLANKTYRFPPQDVIGGPRMRRFYPEQLDTGLLNQIKQRLIWKAANKLEKLKISIPDKPHKAPTLFKVPLIKWAKGMARLSGHHIKEPQQGHLSALTGVLLHFKFFADFHNKAKEAAQRGQHYAGAMEYRRYLRHVAKNPDISFIYPNSMRYENSDSVLKAGLMRTTPAYDRKALCR